MKLEVRFEDVTVFGEKLCAIQVMEQITRGFEKFTASNGWTVDSLASPGIYDNEKLICLRGWNDECDNDIMLTRHPAEVKQAIREFAEHTRDGKREEQELPFEVWNQNVLLAKCHSSEIAEALISGRLQQFKFLRRDDYTVSCVRESENVIRNF